MKAAQLLHAHLTHAQLLELSVNQFMALNFQKKAPFLRDLCCFGSLHPVGRKMATFLAPRCVLHFSGGAGRRRRRRRKFHRPRKRQVEHSTRKQLRESQLFPVDLGDQRWKNNFNSVF